MREKKFIKTQLQKEKEPYTITDLAYFQMAKRLKA